MKKSQMKSQFISTDKKSKESSKQKENESPLISESHNTSPPNTNESLIQKEQSKKKNLSKIHIEENIQLEKKNIKSEKYKNENFKSEDSKIENSEKKIRIEENEIKSNRTKSEKDIEEKNSNINNSKLSSSSSLSSMSERESIDSENEGLNSKEIQFRKAYYLGNIALHLNNPEEAIHYADDLVLFSDIPLTKDQTRVFLGCNFIYINKLKNGQKILCKL